jgi:large subunit ribosomal protein L13
MSTDTVKVYDAEQMVVGRLGSKVAKAALLGDTIVIVNAEKAILTGDRRSLIIMEREVRHSNLLQAMERSFPRPPTR